MYKITLFNLLSLVFLIHISVHAQQDTVRNWKIKSLYTLNGTQNSFVNWNAGGRNNFSMIASIGASALFTKRNLKWSNDLGIALGGIMYLDKKNGNTIQKTDDRLDLSSACGVKFSNYYYTSINIGFRTQMADGFNYPNDSLKVSTFMAPGYLNLALGIDYIKSDKFSVFASLFAAKSTFVIDDSLASIGAFGVEKGSHYRQEYGAYFKMKYERTLAKNIEMKSKLELFSNYLNNPQNIDVNAELLLIFRVNSLFTASAQWNLIYDDDINIRDVNGGFGPRTQFKSVLGIGISYKLNNK